MYVVLKFMARFNPGRARCRPTCVGREKQSEYLQRRIGGHAPVAAKGVSAAARSDDPP
jgi:hypothetical protein